MYQTDVWSVRCIRCHSRYKEQNKWRRFVVLSLKKSLDGFRNTPNVGNNSKTSCCFPFMRSVTSCNWFLAVTEKSFCIAIRIKTLETYFLSSALESSEDGRQSALLSNVLARLFIANKVVRIESEVFVGVVRFTIDTCL